jgi:hypothetical protein
LQIKEDRDEDRDDHDLIPFPKLWEMLASTSCGAAPCSSTWR